MSKGSNTATIFIPLPEELGGEIEAEVSYHIENNGIGAYEFWGAKCFDRGIDYPEIDDIIPIFTEDNDQQAEILQYIDENFSNIAEKVEDKLPMIDQYADYFDE
jgi:hypothetical protein